MSAYYRWFPGDYMRDTIHLGWMEDCAYRRLIDLYQIHGRPIKNDRSYILRAVRANEPEQQAAVDTILTEYFELRADGWHQKKCDAEITFRVDSANHGKKAAEARWKNKANKNNGNADARALPEQCPGYANQNQNQNQNQRKEKAKSTSASDDAHADDFERAWKAYPPRAGGNSKAAAFKAYLARIKEGYTPESLYAGVVRYAAYCRSSEKIGTEYVKQGSTFFGPGLHFLPDSAPAQSIPEERL